MLATGHSFKDDYFSSLMLAKVILSLSKKTFNRLEGIEAQPLLGGFSFQTANGGWPATQVKAV
jgi:hypothetical protein